MSLIKCPECGNAISDKAISCPHCGYPLSLYKAPLDQIEEKKQESVQSEPGQITIKGHTVDLEKIFSDNDDDVFYAARALSAAVGISIPEAKIIIDAYLEEDGKPTSRNQRNGE